MTRFKKISLWITAGFIFCVAVIIILILSADKLINQPSILDKIQTGASEAINGQVTFQRIQVSIFPSPRFVVRQCRFSIPETLKGTVESATVAPKLLSLIMGKFQNSEITLNTPDIEIYFSSKPEPNDKHLNAFSLETVGEKVGAFIGVVLSKAPGLQVRLKNARINILKEKKPPFWIQDMDSRIILFKNHINLDMKGDTSIFRNIVLKGAIHVNKDNLSFTLSRLILNNPDLNLSGKLDIRHTVTPMLPRINMELTGKNVDIDSTRKTALDLAGESSVINDIFHILKGGNVSFIEFASHGKSLEELGELENITIKGHITNGKIFVPEVDLELTGVEGNVDISDGILNGKDLKAGMGASKCLEGTLKLGLKDQDAPFHLDLTLEADLSQLPPILKRVVQNDAFINEMALVDHLKGKASGRLVLGESLASTNVFVNVSQFNLSANYKRLPHPLVINRGQYSYEENTVSVANVSGTMGKSAFNDVSGIVNWNHAPDLRINNGRAKIDLQEIYPWLLSSNIISGKLRDLKNVKGNLALSSIRIAGPIFEPKNYRFQLSGKIRNLVLNSPLLPGSLSAERGNFTLNSENISISDFQTLFHDASLMVSGTVKNYQRSLSLVDMTFKGKIGPDVTRWAEDTMNISPLIRFKAPISISTAHLIRNDQKETTVSADLSMEKDVKIWTDISINSEKLRIEKLIVRDPASNASIKLTKTHRTLDVFFTGNLQKTTLDNIMEENEMLKGEMKGDFQAHILLDQPWNSTVKGELTARDIIFPRMTKPPLVVSHVSLTTKKDILHVESARLVLGDNAFDLKGHADLSGVEPDLNLTLFSDALNLDQLKQDLEKTTIKKDDQMAEKSWTYLFRGTVNAKVKTLTFDNLTWMPFEAEIRFNDNGAAVSITDANVCGITTLGSLIITPNEFTVDIKPTAQNQELNPSVRCLFDDSAKIVGDFNLDGDIKAKGTGQTLMRNLNGDLKFYVSKGRSYAGKNFRILIKIFSILNVTEMFKGKLSNPETNGFAFNSIHVKADIQNGKLVLNEMIVDGTSMNIVCQGSIDVVNKQVDIKALVAPLKTIDFFIKRTPLIKDILGGSLISIPIGIKGHLDNPRVTPIPPYEVGAGLLGIVKRTLQLPVKIIQPISPGKESE